MEVRAKRYLPSSLAILSFALSALALESLSSSGKVKLFFDYAMWGSFFLSLLALWIDSQMFSSHSVISTMLLELIGGFLVILGRIGSILANGTFSLGYFLPLFGTYYTKTGLTLSLLIFPGAFLTFAFSFFHAVMGSPLPFSSGPSIRSLLLQSKYYLNVLSFSLSARPLILYLLVGAVAFVFRFYPELKWGSWLIGWDTPEYVAHLEDFVTNLNPFSSYYWQGGMRNIPPMLDIILLPAALLGGAWEAFKLYPSIAYGILTSLSALLAYRVYRAGLKGSLFAGLFTMLFVLNLRISWDYQRQLLGSIFLLAFLIKAEEWKDELVIWRSFTLVLLSSFASMSHEVIGLAIFVSSLVLLYISAKRGSLLGFFSGLISASIAFSLEAWYWKGVFTYSPNVGYLPVGIVSSLYDLESPWVVSYLIAGMGIAIPLSLYTMSKHPRPLVNASAIALIFAGISPLIAPSTSVATWYRFLIGVSPILSTMTAVGAVEVLKDWRTFFSFFLLFSLPGLAFSYGYNLSMIYPRELREFPYALVPSSPEISYLQVEKFFSENYTYPLPIIADPDIARYVHLSIRNPLPQQLMWSSPSNDTICYAAEISKEAYIVTRTNLSSTFFECISEYNIEDKLGSIFLYKVSLTRVDKAQ
ncbi:MAG: hypothetical protein ACP5LZ_04595 [Fervidicoccaceae archaeon]